jgi:hypothetical protein
MSMIAVLNKSRNRKRGIALIVVLALLAMMVLLSVAFIVSMRSERTASRDFVEVVKARQRVHHIATALVMGREDAMSGVTPSRSAFYHGGYIVSKTTGADPCYNFTNAPSDPNNIRDYIPQNVHQQLFTTDLNPGNITWVGTNANGRLTERHAYVWFDCSDFLDAHTVGTNLVRLKGTAPGDVRIPSEVISTLPTARAGRRFETIGEIRRYMTPARNLVPFSYVPKGQYWNGAGNVISDQFYLGTNYTQIRPKSDSIWTLAQQTVPNMEPGFTNALIDFVAPFNVAASGPRSFGAKNVPMINEVVVSNRLIMAFNPITKEISYTNSFQVWVELWYPFFNSNNLANPRNYTVTLDNGAQYSGAAPVVFNPPAIPNNTTVTYTGPWSATPNLSAYKAKGFRTDSTWQSAGFTNPPTDMKAVKVVIPSITVKYNGAVMDVVSNVTLQIGATEGITIPSAVGSQWASYSLEADDPRLNWEATDTVQWSPSKAGLNKNTLRVRNSRCNPSVGDGAGMTAPYDSFMFCKEGPLENIGELGYLLYSSKKPWRTIRLFQADADETTKLFNVFTLMRTNTVQGLINPNSRDASVLACGFREASNERYPGDPTKTTMSPPNATLLATNLFKRGPWAGVAGTVPNKARIFTNVADVCRLASGDLTVAGDHWQQKAVMRHSMELFHPRQNLWCAIIFAQSVKCMVADGKFDAMRGDFVTGEAGAIMLVWRDPYETLLNPANPGGLKTHKCFIRFFKWL